ncbi:MAG: VWA domain-containing protein [Pseudomonadota bacterium]
MNESKLNALFETLETRPPSPGAEDRAIDAGLQAFRQAAQKSAAPRRPIVDALANTWEWIMQHRMAFGTVTACLVALPLGLAVYKAYNPNIHYMFGPPERHAAVERAPVASRQPAQVPARSEDRSANSAPAPTVLGPNYTAEQMLSNLRAMDRDPSPESDTVLSESVPTAQQQLNRQQRLVLQPNLRAKQESQRRAIGTVAEADAEATPPPVAADRGRQTVGQPADRRFESVETNPLTLVEDKPVSTFSIDVDTASYAFVRRMLTRNALPAPADIRVEEMINYFSYDYPLPEPGAAPFRPTVAVYPTPWNADTRLLHIGIKGRDIAASERPRANLVFLIDTSGSMNGPDRLPLLQTAFRLLVQELDGNDTVSIVTYAGAAGTVLEPTPASDRQRILDAIETLQPGGSTAGAAGIRQAYALAERGFDKDGVNRVILATDGDFNVGMSDTDQLKNYIAEKRKTGVFLSVLGFGEGNYNDGLMQVLAQNGNGNAAYIDTLKEAEKVLVTEATRTLFPIAKDVKIQIEFNPAAVSAYRLVGYETRMLRRQDFNNDRIDAGEIGSGHTVTALYEIVPADGAARPVDNLRYSANRVAPRSDQSTDGEVAFLKLRYKEPSGTESRLIEVPVTTDVESASLDAVSVDMRFAAAVAAFAQKLRGDDNLDAIDYERIQALAAGARGADRFGLRSEFVDLVRLARLLSPAPSGNER